MTMNREAPLSPVCQRLYELGDEKYAAFQSRLIPGIPPSSVIGVRVPALRKFAKEFIKDPACASFLTKLPHTYYDENMLHALIISEIKDYDEIISSVEAFLPFVDNWAVCDIMSPSALKKHKDKLLPKIKEWTASPLTYTCRFGMEMLMSFYLDNDFRPEYLEIPAAVRSDEYYVNMMTAWFFATALSKQWDDTLPYIENNSLGRTAHNMTIRKANESLRISEERKRYLKTLKRP